MGGYDETNWAHVHAKNVAIVGAWIGLAAACYLGYQWNNLHDGRTGAAQSYHGGGYNVTCGRQPVTTDGCTDLGVTYTQAEWIEKASGDYDTMITDGWAALGLGIGGAVTLYSVNQADEARKKREKEAADAAAAKAAE
jgi:hypothetical protein